MKAQLRTKERKIGKVVDGLLAHARVVEDDGDVSQTECGGRGLCPMLGRRAARMLGLSRRAAVVATVEMDGATGAAGAQRLAATGDLQTALFGKAAKKDSPTAKLEQAAAAIRSRHAALDARVGEARQAAVDAGKLGQKALAMREMKRMHQLQKQLASTQSVLDAIEAQSDMIEQTALQREVAAALGATAKSLKKDKKLLSKAEDAVDSAQEMRDLHDDISQVMGGLGEHAQHDFDDDDLMAELQSMIQADDAAPPPPTTAATATGRASDGADDEEAQRVQEAKAELERKHAAYEEAETLRQNLPEVPSTKASAKKRSSIEKRGLLAEGV